MRINLAYGQGHLTLDLPDEHTTVIEPSHTPGLPDEHAAVLAALQKPIAAHPLRQWIKAGDRVSILFADITRATPNERLIPWLLEYLADVPRGNITLLNQLGTHRPNTRAELELMLTPAIVRNYRVLNHDAENPDELVRVFCVVVQDAIVPHDDRREHELQLGAGVRPMGAKLVEQGDVSARDIGEVLEQPGNEPLVRRGAGDVGEQDRDAVASFNPLAQRVRGNRLLESSQDRGMLVRQARRVRGLDDGRVLVGQIESQMALAVSEIDAHRNLTITATQSFSGWAPWNSLC